MPARLEEIVEKALAKSADERYQTAKDFLIDLRNLKRRLEVDAEIERTVPPELRSATSESKDASASSQSATRSQSAASTVAAEQPHSTSSAEYLVSGIRRHKLAALIAILVIISAAIGLYFYLHARDTEIAIDSIAVLPFVNQNNDPEVEYRSDGLTESIINNLTRLPALRVVARSTAFRYKGRETDPMAIGKELGVRAVLTGRVMQRGDNLNVSVELLDVRDNKQLWGEQYERKVSDLLDVQREIAKDISAHLRLKISGTEQARVTRSGTDNPEAYQAYLKGRFYWNKYTEEASKKAFDYFNQAVALDPNYALAYAGLADGYWALSELTLPPAEAMSKAKAAAMKALELDDSLPQAHISLAVVLYRYEHNWAEAEKEIKRAIELNPRDETAHLVYSEYLGCMGRGDEALKEARIAMAIDPLSPQNNVTLIFSLLVVRQYDQAIEQAKKLLELEPDFATIRAQLGFAYQYKGRLDDAIAEFERAYQLDGSPISLSNVGYIYAVAGRKAEAQKILDKLQELSQQRYVSPFLRAQIYAGLGDKNQAFAWLEKTFEARSEFIVYLKFYLSLDPLRSDPRFADLVRRVGLPQ